MTCQYFSVYNRFKDSFTYNDHKNKKMLVFFSLLTLSQAHSNAADIYGCPIGLQPYKCLSKNFALDNAQYDMHIPPRKPKNVKKSIWESEKTLTKDGDLLFSVTAKREQGAPARTTTTYSCVPKNNRVVSYFGFGLHYDLLPEETPTIGKEHQMFYATSPNGKTTSLEKEWDTYHTLNFFLWSLNDKETSTENTRHSLDTLFLGKEIITKIQGQEYIFTTEGFKEATEQTYKECEKAMLLYK